MQANVGFNVKGSMEIDTPSVEVTVSRKPMHRPAASNCHKGIGPGICNDYYSEYFPRVSKCCIDLGSKCRFDRALKSGSLFKRILLEVTHLLNGMTKQPPYVMFNERDGQSEK